MLFHATQSHDYSTCHAHDEERKALMMKSMQSADSIGIKIVGAYADPPGHTLYCVLEADSMEQIVQFFDTMIELGNVDIHPVLSLQDALDQLKKD